MAREKAIVKQMALQQAKEKLAAEAAKLDLKLVPIEEKELTSIAYIDHSCNNGKIIWELDPASIADGTTLYIK
jgi:hypothetical protein